MRFEFATATRILFGPGVLKELGGLIRHYGVHPLVVTGSNPRRAEPLLDVLKSQQLESVVYPVSGEPSIDTARDGVRLAQAQGCDVVIGFGGGSVMDTAKAVAALLTNPGDPLDYLEVIGKGQPIRQQSLPLITIPTTAGTGSEVTSNAVLYSPEHRVKVSLRSPLMLARLAVVDPLLTHSSPPDVTAQSGLDALTQVIEPYVSNKANPLTDAICLDGMRRATWALPRAYEQPEDGAARESMALVSLYGGMALSNAKLGAVHGFAGPFGGMFDAPHGAICARLLPFVMQANVQALRERDAESAYLPRYQTVAHILTGDAQAQPEDSAPWLQRLSEQLQVPPLHTYGLRESDFDTLIEKAAVASSMQGNPIKLTSNELRSILTAAY